MGKAAVKDKAPEVATMGVWKLTCTIPTVQAFSLPVVMLEAETDAVAREKYRVRFNIRRDDAVITAERIG